MWCHVPLSVTLTNFMSNRPEKLDHKVKYLNLTISTVKIHTLPNSIFTVQGWRDVSGMIELLLFAFLGSYLLNIQSITYFTKIFLLPTSCKNPDLNFFKVSNYFLISNNLAEKSILEQNNTGHLFLRKLLIEEITAQITNN